MAVKKGILDNFLKPSSHYSDNQKNLRSIFIDKNEDDFKAEPRNFLEASVLKQEEPLSPIQTNDLVIVIPQEKLEPNLSQSEAKVEPKLKSNLSQSEAKVEPIEVKLEPNTSKLKSKLEPIVEPKLSQTRAKVEPKAPFSSLIGLQRKIVLFIHEICQTILEQQTHALSIEYIAEQCEHPKSAVRKAIQRLEQKEIIQRTDFKNGRGGWTRYQLPDQIYQEILRMKNQKLEPNLSQSRAKLESILSQSRAKLRTELEPQPEPNAPSSSSSLNLIKTTTTELSDEWNFDITPYRSFGFTMTQIKQLVSLGVISAADVEQSLIEFSHDLENNALPPIKTNRINFLMGLLRAGHVYVPEGFKNEQEAMVTEMARRSEAKRKKLLEDKFEAWVAKLSDEEQKEIENKLPTHMTVLYRTYGIDNIEVKNWVFNFYLQIKSK